MHLRHQSYLPARLTANTNRSDFYFDGDEFYERIEEYHDRPLYAVRRIESPHPASSRVRCLISRAGAWVVRLFTTTATRGPRGLVSPRIRSTVWTAWSNRRCDQVRLRSRVTLILPG